MITTLAFFPPSLGPLELIIIAGVALLIFGKRLPDVGRSLGKGIVEFKRGLQGIEEDIDTAGKERSSASGKGANAGNSPKALPDAHEQRESMDTSGADKASASHRDHDDESRA